MFTPASSRAANAYKMASVASSVEVADPHKLVCLLFESLQRAIGSAKLSMEAGNIPAKCQQISTAIRLLEEGLKAPLDLANGGQIAENLNALYEYCVMRLVMANARNDVSALVEVAGLIEPVADGWKRIEGKGAAYLKPVQQ